METENSITLEHTVARSPEHIFNEIDDEVVLLGIESGDFYGFDKILSKIWNMLEQPVAVRTITERLQAEYDVEPEVCERDVLSVFHQMLGDKLIVIE